MHADRNPQRSPDAHATGQSALPAHAAGEPVLQSYAAAEPVLLAHEADGIREYDNPMPFWWSAIFWGTIVWSALYAMYYMIGVGPGVKSEYESDMSAFFQEQAAKLGDLKPTELTILSLANDPKMMQAGAGIFKANCAVCHGADGGGGTGPNLCDESYLNVRKPEDIFTVISEGLVQKGMPAWNMRFGEAQMVLLSAYVAGLRGTEPGSPKAAQGSPIAPWAKISEGISEGDGVGAGAGAGAGNSAGAGAAAGSGAGAK